MKPENLTKLNSVLCAVFEIEETKLSEDLKQGDLENWDSLGQVALISALESEFAMEIDATSFEGATSVQAIRSFLADKGF